MTDITVMIKPASGLCNMRCQYCFYADEMQHRAQDNYGIMTQDTLEIVIQKTIEHSRYGCTFAFQGGEPTLAGLDFFRQVIAFQEKYNTRRIPIYNALQTNGYALTDEWCVFLAKNHFLVGISIDGTKDIHDRFRKGVSEEGTYSKVIKSIRLLEKHHVDFNTLTVVTGPSAKNIGKIYGHFSRNGWSYNQYISCMDPLDETNPNSNYGLSANAMGDYLCRLFDLWYHDAESNRMTYNRFFCNLLGIVAGQPPESCNMMGCCSIQYVVEANGSVFPCDFYALDSWQLGNLVTDSFDQLDAKRTELQFIEESLPVPSECRTCLWYNFCRNGCRRDRLVLEDGQLGKNKYCDAWKKFYPYVIPRLKRLLQLIYAGKIQYKE